MRLRPRHPRRQGRSRPSLEPADDVGRSGAGRALRASVSCPGETGEDVAGQWEQRWDQGPASIYPPAPRPSTQRCRTGKSAVNGGEGGECLVDRGYV